MNADNGTSCPQPPLLSVFFSRLHFEGFNIEAGWGIGGGPTGWHNWCIPLDTVGDPDPHPLAPTLHRNSTPEARDAFVLLQPAMGLPIASTFLQVREQH